MKLTSYNRLSYSELQGLRGTEAYANLMRNNFFLELDHEDENVDAVIEEMDQWLAENAKHGFYYVSRNVVYVENREEAMMFKLRFAG